MQISGLKTNKQDQWTESQRVALLGRVVREGLLEGPHLSRDLRGEGGSHGAIWKEAFQAEGSEGTDSRGLECVCCVSAQQGG